MLYIPLLCELPRRANLVAYIVLKNDFFTMFTHVFDSSFVNLPFECVHVNVTRSSVGL